MIQRILLISVLPILIGGCANTHPRVTPDAKQVSLQHGRFEIPEMLLMDVRVQPFDPGKLPSSKNASRGLSMEIRKSESPYIAAHLKETMQSTGQWGAVRVVPTEHVGDEVHVTGEILKSNGEELKLKVTAIDATGRRWFNKTFKSAVSEKQCTDASGKKTEVFQNIYNKIANEMADYRQGLTAEEIQEIRYIAEMRFAEELVPNAFEDYLIYPEKGFFSKQKQFKLDRLPSENDEMMARVKRVRQSDYELVDTLDRHYGELYREMQTPYTEWRLLRIMEMNMIREVDAKKNAERAKGAALILAGAALGAAGAQAGNYNPAVGSAIGAAVGTGVALMTIKASQISEEAEINKAALKELGISFAAEVEPITLEVEGEVFNLTGSAEEKYKQWSHILAKLYKHETEAEILPEDE